MNKQIKRKRRNNVDIYTYISLYTGAGGLDVGYRRGNPGAIPLLYVERDFEAAAVLVEKIRTGRLDQAPIWSNTSTLDCKPFVGKVDAIIGGFPCQPFSGAGRREGTEDERWLWEDITRLVGEIRPRELFLENVAGLFLGGIQVVIGGLSEMGYDAKWITLQAKEVGAPHQRERVFILAHSRHHARSTKLFGKRERKTSVIGQGSRSVADTDNEWVHNEIGWNSPTTRSGIDVENTIGSRWDKGQDRANKNRSRERANRPSRRPMEFPPGFNDPRWTQVIEERPDLAPRIKTQSKVRGVADGLGRELARSSKLKILGNGVVPKQAAVAYEILKEKL